jgi:general secretion pathway protein I
MRIESPKSKIENGFTLLEVVVAMAIVGLGVVTLLEIFSQGLRLGARSFERSEAIAYGRQALDRSLIRRELRDGGEEGSFGGKHRWRLQVGSFRDENQPISAGWELKEISLKVEVGSGGVGKEVEIKTLRLMKKSP